MPKVETEPENWGLEFDFDLVLDAVLNWYSSNSPLPPTKEDMLQRDYLWDANCRRVRHLLQYQLDGLRE